MTLINAAVKDPTDISFLRMSQDDEIEDRDDGLPDYRPAEEISMNELDGALRSLRFLGEDPYLSTQITGIAIVDQFIMSIETDVMHDLYETERTPSSTIFLSAQTQMWIFAIYEILRTWREQSKDIIKWAGSGGLKMKMQALERKKSYHNLGEEIRASQLRMVVNNPGLVETISADLRLTHFLFADIEHLRVAMAKHQVRGRDKSIAFAPGYGRINRWCGSLEYQLDAVPVIFGNINRRDIADSIRRFSDRSRIPTAEDVSEFEERRKFLTKMRSNPLSDWQET